MNREIKVLYSIFELELAPPFKLVEDPIHTAKPDIVNKHLELLGYLNVEGKRPILSDKKMNSIFIRVKQVFNVNKLSNDDVYHIAKHLFNWLQDKLDNEITHIRIWNDNGDEIIEYLNNKS